MISTHRSTHSSQIALVGPVMILRTSRARLPQNAQRAEFAAQFALCVVVELFGDLPRGFANLLECAGSAVKVGVGIVECGGELVECSVQELPGDDG